MPITEPDPHHFDFDLDRGIREQVVEKLEASPLLEPVSKMRQRMQLGKLKETAGAAAHACGPFDGMAEALP